MRRLIMTGAVLAAFVLGTGFLQHNEYTLGQLRDLYSANPAKWPAPELDEAAKRGFSDIGALEKPVYPAANPYKKEKEKLGKILFFDPRLSLSRQIACASCHDPELGWGDGRRVAYGHDRKNGKRNAMTILNTGFYEKLFWDGRAKSLEDQATFPVQDHVEMNQNLDVMVQNVSQIKGYQPLFLSAFGTKDITLDKIQQAIATFERGVVSRNSRFDAFVKGNKAALKDDELMGLHLFRTKARCINCHNTPLFSDNQFHNDGQALMGSKMEDRGLYQMTHQLKDVGAFRTPSLRETNITGPWMHNGNFPSLRDVIEFYNLGNQITISRSAVLPDSLRNPKSPLLQKLNLSLRERQQLEAFLKSISTSVQKMFPPELPEE